MNDYNIRELQEKERLDYEDSLKVYRDLKNVLDTAELKGLRKGREEGRAEALKNIAKVMRGKGMTLAQISQMTGLTEADIMGL